MQQTLRHPVAHNWLRAAFARLTGLTKRERTLTHGDVKFTDQMERELADREFRRWH